MSARRFSVITQQSSVHRDIRARWPRSIPWTFAETFREQAEDNHDQTLERLHERGGLAPEEIWRAAHGKTLFRDESPSEQECGEWLITKVAELAGAA